MNRDTGFDDESSRHHFIPKYFIDGFADEQGLLFRYDKTNDRIERHRFAPKQAFFRRDGNVAHVGHRRNTIAEKSSSLLDSVLSSQLALIRKTSSGPSINNPDSYVTLLSLATDLFFRVPANSGYYDLLYARSGIRIRDKEGNIIMSAKEILEEGQTAQKSARPFIAQDFLLQLVKQIEVHDKMKPRIAAFSYGVFVLSDNPVVFSELPKRWQDFMLNFILPISSTQFFVYCDKSGYGHRLSLPLNYNALAIHQAQRYVCAGSEVILSAAVQCWKDLRKSGYLPNKADIVFNEAFEGCPSM